MINTILLRMFGRPAGLLGRLGGIVMARTKTTFTEWVLRELGIQPGDRVLEVGYGPGLAVELLSRMAVAHIAGVDPSPIMREQAAARNAAAIAAGRVDLRPGSAGALPFADASFDKALSINSLQMWPDPVGGLNELARVVRPGGGVAIAATRHARLVLADAAALVEASDLTVVRTQTGDEGFLLLAAVPQ